MGLLNIFISKTVESRYKTLLKLFKHTHSSFTITRNEKCIVEFTLKGMEKETLQYGSIEQNFDFKKIKMDGYIVDPGRIVTVTLKTTLGGETIHVQKNYDQHCNQTMMYNEVMKSYLQKVIEVSSKLNDKD